MSFNFLEGDLCFDFDDNWTQIVAWDRHPAYRNGIRQMDGGRAVDVIGIYRKESIFFIEVKDYRQHRREKSEDPWVEFELKVRNTVAGLVGARRCQQYEECDPFVDGLVHRMDLKIILWLETPSFPQSIHKNLEKRSKVGAGSAVQRIKSYVKWLKARVINTHLLDPYQRFVPGLVVTSLPYKRRTMAEDIHATLATRGIVASADERQRIDGSVDVDELERWLRRATVVGSAKELFYRSA